MSNSIHHAGCAWNIET